MVEILTGIVAVAIFFVVLYLASYLWDNYKDYIIFCFVMILVIAACGLVLTELWFVGHWILGHFKISL